MRLARWTAGLLFLAPALLLAQAQGRLKGTVTDVKGAPIAGAKVIITCSEIATFRKELTTDKEGVFTALFVDATKKYLVHIEAAGYQAIEETHKPPIGGQTLSVSFSLANVQDLQKQAERQALDQPGLKELREGKDLLAAGSKAEARAKFEAAVAARADLYLGWLELGVLDFENKAYADSLAKAEKCLSLSSNFSPCLALASNAAREKGDQACYERYLAAYKLANPSDPGVLFGEAAVALNKGDDAAAKPVLEQILEIDPNHADTLFQLGMVYLRAGDNAKAKELLLKFLQVAPQHKDAASATEMLKYL